MAAVHPGAVCSPQRRQPPAPLRLGGKEGAWGRRLLDGSHRGLPAHLNRVMLDRSEHPRPRACPGDIPELCEGEVRGMCELAPVPLQDGSPACGGLVGAQERSPSLSSIVGHAAVCACNPLPCQVATLK